MCLIKCVNESEREDGMRGACCCVESFEEEEEDNDM
jgi:hypothetical protein